MLSPIKLMVAGLFACAATTMWGQNDSSSVTGRVTDPSGAVVAGAGVNLVNVATGVERREVSNAQGYYTFSSLPPGQYAVKVAKSGFRTVTLNRVELLVNETSREDFQLAVGSVAETINVTAASNEIQTESAKTAASITNLMVDELPLVVGGALRSPFDLAAITPEAQNGNDGSINRFGGGQTQSYGASLDGVSVLNNSANAIPMAALNTPSLEAITEFAVVSNGFKAEYDRAQGGMITFASKSGTNDLHGSAYEFLRNDFLDSRGFFQTVRPKYKQHDFGWSAGGPVMFPKLYNGHNRTFFFTSMEWFRNSVGAGSQIFTVPTPEMYRGDFSNWVDGSNKRSVIYDPATTRLGPDGVSYIRSPFPGNQIPEDRFSGVAKGILNAVGNTLYPNVNAAPGTSAFVRNNYINNAGTKLTPWLKYSIKVDHNFSENNRVDFLFNHSSQLGNPGSDGFPGLPGVANGTQYDTRVSPTYRASYVRVIRPWMINSAFGGFNGYHEDHIEPNVTGGWKAKGTCVPNSWDCDAQFPQLNFSDGSSWSGQASSGSDSTTYSFGDDLTITHGTHTFKMGYFYERLHYNGISYKTPSGLMTFDRRSTSVPTVNNVSTGGGNSFASFLLGQVYSGQTENPRNNNIQWRSHAWYFQDDWHITRRLTLNPGVRYEFTLPPIGAGDQISDFSPTRLNPGADGLPGALVFAGSGDGRTNTRALAKGWYGGIGPRLGLTYLVNDKTVLRMSGARSFGVVKTTSGSTHFDGFNIIFSPTTTNSGVTPAFALDTGFPSYPKPPILDPSFSNGNSTAFWANQPARLPDDYTWMFDIQRQISSSTVFDMAYSGMAGVHLISSETNINQIPFPVYQKLGPSLLAASLGSSAAIAAGIRAPYAKIFNDFNGTVSVAQALRPYPMYQGISTGSGQGDRGGHSSYHALILRINRRMAGGLNLQGSYMFSKMLADSDSLSTDADQTALDNYNRKLDKSISSVDQTHNFKANWIWELPVGQGRKWITSGFAARVLGNWRLAGIHFYGSGFPIALSNGINYLIFNGRNAAQIPTYDGWIAPHDNPNWRGADRFFQSASYFGQQSTAVLGNATRYNPKARLPWNLNENFSLARQFWFRESIHLDLRWEAFNALNRVRFSTGSTNITDPNFGLVTSTLNGARQMQLGLKLYW